MIDGYYFDEGRNDTIKHVILNRQSISIWFKKEIIPTRIIFKNIRKTIIYKVNSISQRFYVWSLLISIFFFNWLFVDNFEEYH